MRGILFRDDMIRAILAGRKNQTRRTNRRWLRVKRGDLLYVKETWCLLDRDRWYPDRSTPRDRIVYREECLRRDFTPDPEGERCRKELGYKWRSPLHMPEKYSRLILEATEDARLVKLQSISELDAEGEGVEWQITEARAAADNRTHLNRILADQRTPIESFRLLWDSIHGAEKKWKWSADPEIVRIAFRIWKSVGAESVR